MSKTPRTKVLGVLPCDMDTPLWTRPVGVRVQKVQRVHRVQRGWWAAVFTKGPAPPAQRGRMSSIGPLALGAKGCVRFAQGAKALVGAFKLLKAPVWIKPLQPPCGRGENMKTALRAGKTIQPRLWREEMHPFCRLRRHLSTGKRLT